MKPIQKLVLDICKLRLPVNVKRLLESGELHTYDILNMMGNTINSIAHNVEKNVKAMREFAESFLAQEKERIENEKERIAAEDHRKENEDVRELNETVRKRNEKWRQQNEAERIFYNKEAIEDIKIKAKETNDALMSIIRKPYVVGSTVYMTPYANIHVENNTMIVI